MIYLQLLLLVYFLLVGYWSIGQLVNIKLNSQKHSSVKEKLNFNSIKERQLNFANIARSRARQRGINSTNANTLNNCPDNNISADNYNTPFKFYRKGKGMYLKPGK